MKTLKIMRRVVGIITVVLLVIVLVGAILGENHKLIWHLDSKALVLIPVFALVYAVLLTIYVSHTKVKAWGKAAVCFGCFMVFLICFFLSFFVNEQFSRKVWEENGYVVYEEYRCEHQVGELGLDIDELESLKDSFETKFVLYKRCGFFDERLLVMRSYVGCGERNPWWVFNLDGNNPRISFTIFENLDLIRMESSYKAVESDGTSHISYDTSYCRFSDGLSYFGREERDSVMRVIQKTNY